MFKNSNITTAQPVYDINYQHHNINWFYQSTNIVTLFECHIDPEVVSLHLFDKFYCLLPIQFNEHVYVPGPFLSYIHLHLLLSKAIW